MKNQTILCVPVHTEYRRLNLETGEVTDMAGNRINPMKSKNEQILDALCNGYTVNETAKMMGMNRRTVEARILNMRMLNRCRTVTQLCIQHKTDQNFIMDKFQVKTLA
ncbi:helix-turn-helix transcriptional regulator [Flavitalea antarctica]